MIRLLLVTIAALALAGSCTFAGAGEEQVLISLTDEVIVPRYRLLAERMAHLDSSLASLCARPSEAGLEDARGAWRAAREPLMRSEAMWFGPMMDRRSLRLVDWSEVDPVRIEAMLAERESIDAATVRDSLSSTQRGLGAVEYVLFDPDAVRALSDPGSLRCAYLVALGEVARVEVDAVLAEWDSDRSGRAVFRDFFTGRSASSMLSGTAVAELVRTQVFLARSLADMRLATALGLRGGGPDPSAIPGGLGHPGLSDLRNELLGMRDMYEGSGQGEGLGISDLIVPLSEETDRRMRDGFEAALAAVDAIEGPLAVAVIERPRQVRAAYDRLSDLRMTLNTEVVSLLGVSVGFSDTDGDSLR